ncbi:DUF4232 domain-containing protein [Streptomyces sp. NPDC005017]|uniref:DUF4232 domain-containing protein n=1 Tax=Streptomyces sp. NPDC005017 TaxID=3364706 RepID=UPI0036B25A1E
MRAVRITVAALAASLALTACGGGGSDDSDPKPRAGGACAVGNVKVEAGPANAAPAAGDTGNLPVTVTNNGPECTLKGFPGIELRTADTAAAVAPDPAANATTLTLAEGASTSVTLTYVRGEAGTGSLDVQTLRFTLPGASESQDFPWSYGPVAGTADAPEASVTPFQQTGD